MTIHLTGDTPTGSIEVKGGEDEIITLTLLFIACFVLGALVLNELL